MANPAHEALLRQGVEEWNDWRAQNGSVTPDLAGVRMPAARLEGVDLSHARLKGATLIRSRLDSADLCHADLREAQLHEAELNEADLFRANLEGAILASAKLRGARLCGANLRRAQMTVVDFSRADFSEARLTACDLRESLGTGASFQGADLSDAELARSILAGCCFSNASGLTSRQLELAITDELTVLPESLGGAALSVTLESLCRALHGLKARATGDSVAETDVLSYHSLLDQLDTKGVETLDSRIRDDELVRPATTWERTRAGEAFEPDSRVWVDAALFRRRVEDVLARLK